MFQVDLAGNPIPDGEVDLSGIVSRSLATLVIYPPPGQNSLALDLGFYR